MRFLELLRAFFRLGVDGDPEPDPKDDKTPPADEPDPADDLELDLEGADPDPKQKGDDRPSAEEFEAARAAEKDARERADRAERENSEFRRQRGAPQEDEITRRENAQLADEKTPDLTRWQINANRELRAGRTQAQLALAQANDVSDRTSFQALGLKNPALVKRYEERVEKQLANIRANGGNASREALLKYLVGEDAMNGKLTKKKAADKPAGDVPRGKLPGARSDIPAGKGAMTNRQKLEKKLDGVQI